MPEIITGEQQYDDTIANSGNKVLVAMFESKDCQFCPTVKNYASQLEAQYPANLELICIDIETPANEPLLTRFEVHETPTFVIYYKGKQVYKLVGSNLQALYNTIMGSLF